MLEIKEVHECVKPDMRVGTIEVQEHGLFKRKTVTVPIYQRSEARYTCEVCGARWTYRCSLLSETSKGFWSLEKRGRYAWKRID